MFEALRDLFVLNWERLRRSRWAMWVMRPMMILLITLKSFFIRVRMSHENGLVARGHVRVLENADIPGNTFFTAGRVFPCRLRHASVSFFDDAALVVRSASLKFADAPVDSPCDILMNNGNATPFWNMDTFWQFTRAKISGGRAKLIGYFERNPRCYMNVRDALRFDPESFAHLKYHSQIPLEFRAQDGVRRYAKFRLIPKPDTHSDDGIPTEEQLAQPWFQEAVSNEVRSRNYLKDEYRARVAKGPVGYLLQIQLLDWKDGDNRDYELNSLFPWDEAEFPWRDLAEVTIDGTLDYHEGNLCLYSLRHLPKVLRVVPAIGYEDGPSIDYLRLGGWWPRRARLLAYKLFGQRDPIPDKREETAVDYADQTISTVFSGDVFIRPSLPQHDDAPKLATRERMLEAARGLYQYMHGYIRTEATPEGDAWTPKPWYRRVFAIYEADPIARLTVPVPLPPFVRNLPAKENYSAYISGRLYKLVGASVLSLALSLFENRMLERKGIDAYRHLFALYRNKPRAMKHWREDAEIGRQRLGGINPKIIRLFTKVPKNFPVTEALLKGVLRPGETLKSAIAKKRLYVCDYAMLDGISVKEGRYLTHPIVLYYVGEDKALRPVAIQLYQSPKQGPIFTPSDDAGTWLAVKAYAQSADAQVHEVIEHLLHGHLIIEVFDIAMHRTLSPAHPIHKMLMPHLEYTMAVNTSARSKMLAPGGPIDLSMAVGAKGAFELLARGWWEDWDFSRHNIPGDLKARGVDDPEALPGYYWRDDALKLWAVVGRYVKAMVGEFYADDQAVRDDSELQAFHAELRGTKGGNVRGLPGGAKGFTSRAVLTEFLTRLIYIASAGHAAGNNGQYDIYGFVPNTPGALYAPPPASKDERWSEADLADALPSFKAASIQILMVRLLSRPTEMPIGSFPTSFFAGTNSVWPVVRRFRHDLHALSEEIARRNAGLAEPYTYLDPVQVARSITA